jgi:hypothetical protein
MGGEVESGFLSIVEMFEPPPRNGNAVSLAGCRNKRG